LTTSTTFLRGAVAALALVAAPMSVSASGVNILHDENADGDLVSNGFVGPDLGALAVGDNVVEGRFVFSGEDRFQEFEGFEVGLGAGQKLESLSFESPDFDLVNVGSATAELIVSEFGNEIGRLSVDVGKGGITAVGAEAAGSYFVKLSVIDVLTVDPENTEFGGRFDYTITLNVSGAPVVPLPASLPLLGAGLLGLGVLARRRRQAG
jgi:hypothetical protein